MKSWSIFNYLISIDTPAEKMPSLNHRFWRRNEEGPKPTSQLLINVVPATIMGGVVLISCIVLFFLVRRKKRQERATEAKERESLEIDIYPTASHQSDMPPGLFLPHDDNSYPEDKDPRQCSSSSTPYGGPSTTSLHQDYHESRPSRPPFRPEREQSESTELPTYTSTRPIVWNALYIFLRSPSLLCVCNLPSCYGGSTMPVSAQHEPTCVLVWSLAFYVHNRITVGNHGALRHTGWIQFAFWCWGGSLWTIIIFLVPVYISYSL